jgi:protocatechuate 3,4-dioxygenase, alpha subunit
LSPRRTPSQTVGPFHAIAMRRTGDPHAVPEGHPGAVWISGRVLDGDGEPVDDAIVETWQSDPVGTAIDDGPSVPGFGRCLTNLSGGWAVLTTKPRPPDGARDAPHLSVAVFARGLLKPVWTRIYFGDEAEANAGDAVLALVDPDRRATLLAQPSGEGYRFDIRLQGEGETVFFDV